MSIKVPRIKNFLIIFCLLALVAFLGGCSGDDGAAGAAGADGDATAATAAADAAAASAAAAAATAAALHTDESCNVCHGEGAVADVAEVHPMLEKPVVSNIVVSRSVGDVLTVTFTVKDLDGDPVEGIGLVAPSSGSDIRVYMAAIVPAGTVTANAPVTTWETDYLESWAEERGSTAGTVLTEPTAGNYSFQMTAGALAGIGGADAPEALITDKMRVYVRADARDFDGFNRTMGVADFDMPAAGANTGVISATTRTIVTMEACTQCHGDPLEQAAHGGGYQSPQVCNFCHSPIGERGDEMQDSEAWLASLIHKIHQAVDMDAFPDRIELDVNGDGEIRPLDFNDDNTISAAELADPLREEFGYSKVAYPRHPSDCAVCHFDDGQDAYADWTMPKVSTCGTCHVSAAAVTHLTNVAGTVCTGCHDGSIAPSVVSAHAVTTLKNDPAHGWQGHVDEEVTNVPTYTATLSLTAPANGTYYVAGEAPVVTVTASNMAAGDYNVVGGTRTANLYVYGPRSGAVPVLTPDSTTDPAFIAALALDPTETADQGRSMLIDNAAGDAQILTDANGFKYQLQAIPADLASGTYMVMAYVTTDTADCSGIYRGSVCIDGWVYTTFQVGTATEEPRVAGDCSGCHDQTDWTTFYHRSYFGTDGCIACHDQSGNHANPIANRVHAIHAQSITGDLLGAEWNGSDPVHSPTFPRNTYACEACHTSGNESYLADPVPVTWGVPCIGCHGDTSGAREHMIQNGAGFSH